MKQDSQVKKITGTQRTLSQITNGKWELLGKKECAFNDFPNFEEENWSFLPIII